MLLQYIHRIFLPHDAIYFVKCTSPSSNFTRSFAVVSGLICTFRTKVAASGPGQLAIKFVKTFCRRMKGYLSANWRSTEVGWCNRTTTQNTEANQQRNGFNRRKYTFWNGPVRVLTSTRLRCCGMTSREQFTPDILIILLNWNSFVKRNGLKFLLTVVQVWSTITENVWLRLLLPKEGQPVIKSKDSHTFPTLHCECLYSVFNKDMKTYNCWCVISLSRLCLSVVEDQIKCYDQFMQKSR